MEDSQPKELVKFSEEILYQALETFDWKDIDCSYKDHPIPKATHALHIIVPQKSKYIQHRFAHLLKINQYSERAFALTTVLLDDDSGNYYALMFRKNMFAPLNKDPKQQLQFVTYLLQIDPKCYQIWTYRRFLASLLKFEGEYQVIDKFIHEDLNNYHIWSYRIWVTTQSENYEKEWENSNKSRQSNFRMLECNSYWSYRMFLFQKTSKIKDREQFNQEIKHCVSILREKDTNECIWNYLNGLLNKTWIDKKSGQQLKYFDYGEIKQLCSDKSNRFKLNTLALISKQNGQIQEWRNTITQLITKDRTRKLYYEYILQQQHD